MEISIFKTIKERKEYSFLISDHDHLIELITGEINYAWSPILWKNKQARKIKNFKSCSLLVLDIDKDCTVEKAIFLFKAILPIKVNWLRVTISVTLPSVRLPRPLSELMCTLTVSP